MIDARCTAYLTLQQIYLKDDYTDVALNRILHQNQLREQDRGLATELVYGIVRKQRTLDTLINQLGKKTADQQPPKLRIILHLGLYQLRYLDQIPPSAAVNTSVELAKTQGLKKLSGVVNGVLRQYLRLAQEKDPLQLPDDPIQRLGVLYSFPDWMILNWIEQFGEAEAEKLCAWFNQTPQLHLRINPLQTTVEEVQTAFAEKGITTEKIPELPQGLRLLSSPGKISDLPGYDQGWWTVQDGSAQLVSHILDPQPGETIIDACAAPGGKTTHIAELMGDRGIVWGRDRASSRLKKVQENAQRLKLRCIQTQAGDSRRYAEFTGIADKVLLDAPCSGLGTLHKRPDLRWRKTFENTRELSELQRELLNQAATWTKPNGVLVYATCTLNPVENEQVVQSFLHTHSQWQLSTLQTPLATNSGWLKILPHYHNMDGFFIAHLSRRL
jgi:16S rRNA (cytosine967-C5)-methyltransferase